MGGVGPRGLVGIFAVPKRVSGGEAKLHGGGNRIRLVRAGVLQHPSGNGGVVGRGGAEGFRGQGGAGLEAQLPIVLIQLVLNACVLRR